VALRCTAYGNPPQIALAALPPLPAPGHGEVLIDVQCAALNFTDHLMMQGRYQERPALPFTPGLDAGGTVRAVGSGVSDFAPGDRVVSSGVVGAYASQLLAPAARLVRVPAGLAVADAVASINSHLTAYHGLLDRAALQACERVLVLGAGGAVGRAAVQLALHRGAAVFTVERVAGATDASSSAGSSADEAAADRDATAAGPLVRLRDLSAGTERLVPFGELRSGLKDVLGARGADVVVDPIGDVWTEPAVRSLAWRGRLLVIGFAAGAIPSVPLNLLLLKGAGLLGVYCGGLLLQEPERFSEQLVGMFALMADSVLAPSLHEAVSARDFEQAWQRFSAGERRKLLFDFSV